MTTQAWVERELPCLNCSSRPLAPTPQNTKARDFVCESCDEPYELKSKAGRFSRWVVDGEYRTLLRALQTGKTPNFILLEYDPVLRTVERLQAIHRTLLSPLAITPRRALSAGARRAGWQGCNLDLNSIPPEGRVSIVRDRMAVPWWSVREAWSKFEFMVRLRPEARKWLGDVMSCVEKLPPGAFTLNEVYEFDGELAEFHPNNRHIRPKIRQQLQILVARGMLRRIRPGKYVRSTFSREQPPGVAT